MVAVYGSVNVSMRGLYVVATNFQSGSIFQHVLTSQNRWLIFVVLHQPQGLTSVSTQYIVTLGI